MEQSLRFSISDRYSDAADLHDALYSYNLSRTKAQRVDVHAERYQEQFTLLACDESGNKRGGISFHWKNDPRHIFVDFFFLEEMFRGNGSGRRLFEALIVHAKENGAEKIDLTTNTFQAPGFYLKMGFRITHEENVPYPGCPENIHYSLTLDL